MMLKNSLIALTSTLALGMGVAGTAEAALLGDEIGCEFTVIISSGPTPNLFSSSTAIVGAGPECTNGLNSLFTVEADFFEEDAMSFLEIILTNVSSRSFGFREKNFSFTDLDWVGQPGAIVGLTVVENTHPTLDSFSFTSDSINVSFLDIISTIDPGEMLTTRFKIEADHIDDVPEPLTILGTVTALGVGAAMKRKRSSSVQ
jgi:hypothetical protein